MITARFLTLALIVLLCASAPLQVFARDRGQPARIGVLIFGAPGGRIDEAVFQGLRERGLIEGQNILIERRYANGDAKRLAPLADELARLKPDVIVCPAGDAALAVKKATDTIPIVMGTSGDPVRMGLVESLSRPGGNVTGVSLMMSEVAGKRLELLKEVLPAMTRVGLLWDPRHLDNDLQQSQAAAGLLGIEMQSLEMSGADEVSTAVAAVRGDAISVVASRLSNQYRQQICGLAIEKRLPTAAHWREFAEAGCLLSYGPSLVDMTRRLGVYVEKILNGAKPSDLPVEQPTSFELILNMKTAKTLGITIPQSLLLRADAVIE